MSERPSIESVLEHYDVVGRRKKVSCILHEDRTPSCSINYKDDLWRCFSCGKGGTSWDLIMEKEEVDFRGAQEFAARLGLATGEPRDGGEFVRGSAYGGGRKIPRRTRDRPGGGGYTPSWRR